MGTHPMAAALAKGSHAATEAIPRPISTYTITITPPQASKENEPGEFSWPRSWTCRSRLRWCLRPVCPGWP